MSVNTNKQVAESGYPLVWLLGHADEARVVVDDGTGGYWVPNLCPH